MYFYSWNTKSVTKLVNKGETTKSQADHGQTWSVVIDTYVLHDCTQNKTHTKAGAYTKAVKRPKFNWARKVKQFPPATSNRRLHSATVIITITCGSKWRHHFVFILPFRPTSFRSSLSSFLHTMWVLLVNSFHLTMQGWPIAHPCKL